MDTSQQTPEWCRSQRIKKWIAIIVISGTFAFSAYHIIRDKARKESNTAKPAPPEKVVEEVSWIEAQQKFTRWCLENTAVTEVHFESDWQIWITLTWDKYTTDIAIENIAYFLAKAYKNQSGYPGMIIVTIWSPSGSRTWKGHVY